MKKTIILSAAMAFATFGAFAQEAKTATTTTTKTEAKKPQVTVDERAKRQADKINATVQLNAVQYAKVLEVTKNFAGQKEALRTSSAPGEDLKAKFKALGQQEEEQLKSILTADQFTKLVESRKNRADHKPE